MSHEIAEAPPSIELQPQRSPPGDYPRTIVEPKPSPATTTRGFRIRKFRQSKKKEKNWFEDMRGWIMIVGVQVAAATYASGLSPPGGFWPDDKDGHTAGNAILHDQSKSRYTAFYYANATAFMASLVVTVLLMNEKFYLRRSKVVVLNIFTVLGLISLMVAYAAGSARRITTSIYVIILAGCVLLVVIFSAHILRYVGSWMTKCCPFMGKSLCPRWMRMLNGKKKTHMHKTPPSLLNDV